MDERSRSAHYQKQTSSGAAKISLREEIRQSWRGRKVSSLGSPERLGLRLRLSDRDFAVLRFILEMKFATHHEVHWKFFRRLEGGRLAVSDEGAKKRLYDLQEAGLIKPFYIGVPRTKQIVITREGYKQLSERFPEEVLTKPCLFLDLNLLKHDRYVTHERLRLEEEHGQLPWISDRALQSRPVGNIRMEKKYWPDAIYRLPSGERVALELENATKGKNAYKEKIDKYVVYFRYTAKSDQLFDRVRFVCVEKRAFEILTDAKRIYAQYFTVERLTPFQFEGGAK